MKKVIITVVIIAAVAAIAYGYSMRSAQAPQTPPETVDVPPSGNIIIQGMIVCLPHRYPGEMQTLECAFGLKDDLGRYFALRDTDPMYSNVGSAPMNVRVEVSGTFTPQNTSNYADIGVIDVSKITELQ